VTAALPSASPPLGTVRAVKVGLVLGAGGVQGGAWLTGALDALVSETGWDPAEADRIVGTSAGAMIGAIVSSGVPVWFMVAHSGGETIRGLRDAGGRPASAADRSAGARFTHDGLPSWPGSWRLALATLRSPRRFPPAAVTAGWLPRGFISTEPLKDTVRRAAGDGWSPHPGVWIVACDYATGRRVVFGRPGSPPATLADAVAASCAIPGFYRPVEIDGRLYVDGGMWSTSNLDVIRDQDLDVVICLNPTSSLHPTRAWNPVEWFPVLVRRETGRRLGHEAKKLRAGGTDVVLIQPTGADLRAMGPNLMSNRRRHATLELARRTTVGPAPRPGRARGARGAAEGIAPREGAPAAGATGDVAGARGARRPAGGSDREAANPIAATRSPRRAASFHSGFINGR
jgi:NTE family protein